MNTKSEKLYRKRRIRVKEIYQGTRDCGLRLHKYIYIYIYGKTKE